MQEEALFFNKLYGFQVILIPVRAERISDETEDSVAIGTSRRAPAKWRMIPGNQADPSVSSLGPQTSLNPDIALQIERISEEFFGDLFVSDSQKHFDKIRDRALLANDEHVCYLTLTMLVPKGNPYSLHSVKDVLETHRTLGIMHPSYDGLGESSWKVLSKITPGGESAIPMELVQIYDRQYALLEALELGKIDAALVWNATSQINFLLVKYAKEYNEANESIMREAERKNDKESLRYILQTMYNDIVKTKSFAEEVPLNANPDERCVTAIRLVTLSTAYNSGQCRRFAGYMRSNQAKDVLRRFGFIPE
jgi:ABC-type molybdate transport system substrate-binding protein